MIFSITYTIDFLLELYWYLCGQSSLHG